MYPYQLAPYHTAIVFSLTLLVTVVLARYGTPLPADMRTRLESRKTSIVFVVLLCLLVNLALAVKYGVPAPAIHDEFAYLLSADTFARGRLTNPPHPMWEHLQTFHVFFSPTYQAKYPPGQGLFLALGQIVADMPILGVWASLALACGACCWMFQALLPAGWATLGTLLIIFNPFLVRNWGHTYWGGAVALLGGALYFGAFFRLRQNLRLKYTIAMGIGVIILANSRPFEGFVLCLASAPFIACQSRAWIKQGLTMSWFKRFVLPLSIIGALLAGWILYYDFRLTGHMFKFYYANWQKSDGTIPLIYNYVGSIRLTAFEKLRRLYDFFVGPVLCFSVIGAYAIFREKRIATALVLFGVVLVASIVKSNAWPHYLAPAACLLYAAITYMLATLSTVQIKAKPWGRWLVTAALSFYFISGLVFFGFQHYFRPNSGWMVARQYIQQMLTRQDGRDLVFVRYGPNHVSHWEWVYNQADIDGSPVVWAHDLGPDRNKELMAYFPHRQVWVVLADKNPPQLFRYRDGKIEPYIYYDF